MNETAILIEYEEILIGRRKIFSRAFNAKDIDEKKMFPVFYYVFEYILHWDPETVRDYVNYELLSLLKLWNLVLKMKFPQEISIQIDTFYLAVKLYPDQIHYSRKKLVLHIYEQVLHNDRHKFPRNFFDSYNGQLNASLCLQYAIKKKGFKDIFSLYIFFGNERKAKRFLIESHLYQYFYGSHYMYPVDFLHESLPSSERSELYYHYVIATNEYKQIRLSMQKEDMEGENNENHC